MQNNVLLGKVDLFCAWYKLTRCWSLLQVALFASLAVLAAILLVNKVFCFTQMLPVSLGIMCAAAIGAFTVLVAFILLPSDRVRTCYLIDSAVGLRNLVGSGVYAVQEPGEVSDVVAERALAALAGRAPHKTLPLTLNRAGRNFWAPVVLVVVAALLPQMDVLGVKAQRDLAEADRKATEKGALKLAASISSVQAVAGKIEGIESKQISKDFAALGEELKGMDKQEALVKLGEFENKYRSDFKEQRQFEQAAKALQHEPKLEGLSDRSRTELQELVKSMNKGEFDKAGEALRELAKELGGKKASPGEKKALARELGKIANQLKSPALDKDLAKLLSQIEASPENLSDLTKMCENAANDLSDMAKFCSETDAMNKMKNGLSDAKKEMLGDSFSDFNAKEVEEALRSESLLGDLDGKGQCEGQGEGEETGSGGTGGAGHGRGGVPPESPTDTSFQHKMSQSKINKGKILHELFVSGVPEKGEASSEYSDIVKAAKQDAAGSLARDKVPREYEDAVKTYFDSIDPNKIKDTKSSP